MSVARSCPAGACCALVNDLECAYADPISICHWRGKGHGQRNGLVLQHNAQTQLKLRSFSAALVPGLSSKSVQRAAH
eukprot:1161355-Pelagomonas_calceolata.AAC.5